VWRRRLGRLEVLLVHPGGPFWKKRDDGAWSIPKGEIEPGETATDVARREFKEELGQEPPASDLVPLGTVRQAGGKVVHAWGAAGDYEAGALQGMTFEVEWPPHSGKKVSFPEVDRAAWFDLQTARLKVLDAQRAFIDRLEAALG
jgi:predicted NUDIX family NTP pyrophosphohydrolase